MGTYKVHEGNGNRVTKEGKMGFEGKTGRTPPGKVIFIMREIRV